MSTREVWNGFRHPVDWLRGLTAGEAVYPILILFGLNAVDELDRTAFGILLPEIREAFGLDLTATLALVALVSVGALALQVPIAQLADRRPRVPLMIVGALVWAVFSGLTGLAMTVVVLAIARSGSAIGKAVIDPTHNSLIADYYPIETRNRVYSFHRAANAVGGFLGPLTAGILAYRFGWRVPFLVFVVPTVVIAILGLRLLEPVRGRWERVAAGADEHVAMTEEPTPSFAEGWRTVQRIPTLRRVWASLPFLATSLIGFVILASLMYDQAFGLDERERGFAAAVAEPFQLVGLVYGSRIVTRRFLADPPGLIRFVARMSLIAAALAGAFAVSPNIYVAVAVNCAISALLAVVAPGVLTVLALAIPPRARATGFSVASLWVIPGLVALPLIGWIADQSSIRIGMLVMIPSFVAGALVLRSVEGIIEDDIREVWQNAAARSEALYERRQGRSALMLVRRLESGYAGRRVVNQIDLDLEAGEIVALLGTNGAGKSTLLKSISGVVEADRGAVILDGRDITHAPPNEIANLGVVQLPGGAGVFTELTVRENLELAEHFGRSSDPRDTETVLELFPRLAERFDQRAGDLSGGEQQMLALAMCFVNRPRVLLVDELSLGLAPLVVASLLPLLRRLADEGVGIIVVEQSVNLALEVADRALFMERGEIKFSGPAEDLLERPDLLRSVFLSGAAGAGTSPNGASHNGDDDPTRSSDVVLEVHELVVRFGGLRAVDEVSLTVRQDEIVGIIGPNGAGKTTLFDLISGFTRHQAGEIRLGGRDIGHEPPDVRARRGLGRSFQSARLFPELTVRENIEVAQGRFVEVTGATAVALHLPNAYDSEQHVAARADELIELFGLGGHRHHLVRELSTGTRRIVDLACLVAHRPRVILLDEPTAGIAQREVEALVPVVRRLHDEMGAALVVIDHDLPFLGAICGRFVALAVGRVIAEGSPHAVLNHPDVIESYLGSDIAAIARSSHDATAHAHGNGASVPLADADRPTPTPSTSQPTSASSPSSGRPS